MQWAYSYIISQNKQKSNNSRGFTIVELLIVVVVIAILAAVTIVAYNGISTQAKESALKSDLVAGAKQLQLIKVQNGNYPADSTGLKKADTTTFTYTYDNSTQTFCLSAASSQLANKTYRITEDGTIEEGSCGSSIVDGATIQTVTTSNCPATRTRAVDARDNKTYWVQKLADGRCWMLTNLAYAGGGTNTYNDVIPTGNGSANTLSGPGSGSASYTLAKYYVPTGANPTSEPTNPSDNTVGGGSGTARQYGYLYNWCAAMGAQSSTSACANASTPAADTSKSVCPSGWRLPTGEPTTGAFMVLNTAINNGLTNTDTGLLSSGLMQRSGSWWGGFGGQGTYGAYWSATQLSAANVYRLYFSNTTSSPDAGDAKDRAFAVRCLTI